MDIIQAIFDLLSNLAVVYFFIIIGIIWRFSPLYQERFTPDEVDFFRQAAGLVAVAIENARAYESIEKLMEEESYE